MKVSRIDLIGLNGGDGLHYSNVDDIKVRLPAEGDCYWEGDSLMIWTNKKWEEADMATIPNGMNKLDWHEPVEDDIKQIGGVSYKFDGEFWRLQDE